MVKILLNLIRASRSCNLLVHLESAEETMLDFSSMNRMKYHIVWPVYIADMCNLHHGALDI